VEQVKTKPREGRGAAEPGTMLWGCGAVPLPGRSLSYAVPEVAHKRAGRLALSEAS
jgi:hypothetical protein